MRIATDSLRGRAPPPTGSPREATRRAFGYRSRRRSATRILSVLLGFTFLTLLLPLSQGSVSRPGIGGSHSSAASGETNVPYAATSPTHESTLRPSPSAALALNWTGITPAAISLAWTAAGFCVLGWAGYVVEFSTVGASGPWQTAATIPSQNTVSTAVTGLTPGATYWWRIGATCGGTSYGNVLQATQPPLSVLTYTKPMVTTATFNWTNLAQYGGFLAFSAYALYEATNGSVPILLRTIPVASTLTATVNGLSSATSYLFFLNTTDCYSGCGGGTALNTVTQSNSVTFGTPVALGASVLATRPVVDAGQLDYFTCTPSGGVSPFRYDWNFGSGTFVPGGSGASFAFLAAGISTVACRITDNASTMASASVNILVHSAPSLGATTNRTRLDVGQSVALNATAGGGTSPYAIAWTFGDGTGSSVGNVTHTYSRSGSLTAICVLQDTAGVQLVHSVPLTISPLLTLGTNVTSGAAAPGTSLHFGATATNGTGTYANYSWSFGDGRIATGPAADHSFTTSGTYSVTATVSDSNGARATSSLTVRVTPITVHSTTSSVSIVAGNSVDFSAIASGGAGGPYVYSWTFGDGSKGTGASVTHRFASSGTFSVGLVVTDALGAASPQSPTSISVSAAPGPFAWLSALLLLGIAAIAGLLVGLFAFYRRRNLERDAIPSVGWVPGTDLRRTVRGVKICDYCGRSNLPLRRTCEGCGHPLSRRVRR